MKKMLQGLVAIASTAGFFIAVAGLEGGLSLWQSFIIGTICGLGMIKSYRALGVMD